jgi:nucleoid-associated protein YgaU
MEFLTLGSAARILEPKSGRFRKSRRTAMGARFGREERPRRPVWGRDLRLGILLALGLAVKFGPPMMSAKIAKPSATPMLAAVSDPSKPPTDALTNTLPTTVKPAAANADEPPVLTAPVFALEEKTAPKTDLTSDPLDPPKPPPKIELASKKDDAPPPRPIKLRPPESLLDDPPIVLADAPKKATESKDAAKTPAASSQPGETKGPIHPYFQRYLDQKEYFVRPGDTLESIARRLYQDESKTADLLAANRESLAAPDALKPGMTIRLP